MSVPGDAWWRWMLPATVAVVVVLGAVARARQPSSTLVSMTRAATTATLTAPQGRPLAAWRLQLTWDPDFRPPGPEWVLYEGARPGEGYELRWQPDRLAFQIARGADAPLILGATLVDHAPTEVVFARHGLRLSVLADGHEVLRCLDLAPPPAPAAWGFQAAAAIGDAVIRLHDDERVLTAADRELLVNDAELLARAALDHGRPDHAVVQARAALVLDERAGPLAEAALADAELAAQALGDAHPDRGALAGWLAAGRLRLALARGDLVAARRAVALVEAAVPPARGDGPPARPAVELPGVLIAALGGVVQRATSRPQQPIAAESAIGDRLAWIALTADLAHLAIDAAERSRTALGDTAHWQLNLVAHGAECLRGAPPQSSPAEAKAWAPQPTPAEAPAWVISRWRAFAGRNPRVAEFPAVPLGWLERDPLGATVDRLAQAAALAPLAAVGACARVLDALERGDPAEALAAAGEAPPREAALDRAALALAGIGSADEALAALAAPVGDQPALVARDPLAYALSRLLRRRTPRSHSPADTPDEPAPVHLGDEPRLSTALPAGLAPYERLLSGTPEATQEIWLHDAALLPPAQALAAALAMQETCGTDADWSLLARLPSCTVPLGLLAPPAHAPPP